MNIDSLNWNSSIRPNSPTISGLGSRLSPDDSSCGNSSRESSAQASVSSDQTTETAVTDFQDSRTSYNGSNSLSTLGYLCPVVGCERSCKRDSDLKRHMKCSHDPDSPIWKCGCCGNLGLTGYTGNKREDKVRAHLRKRHATRDSTSRTPAVRCPVECCYMIFIASSCLDEHLEQMHPHFTSNAPSRPDSGSECGCQREALAKRSQRVHQSRTSERRPASPLESLAKRVKHSGTSPLEEMTLQPIVYGANLTPTMEDSGYGSAIVGLNASGVWNSGWDLMTGGQDLTAVDPETCYTLPTFPEWYGNGQLPLQPGSTTMNQSLDLPYQLPSLPLPSYYEMDQVQSHVLSNSKLAAFLAVRESQVFQDIASTLHTTNATHSLDAASSITYNMRRATITLKGTNPALETAVITLQQLLESFSKRRGEKYLMSSNAESAYEGPKARQYPKDSSTARLNNTMKVFPITPKDNRRVVGLWFKFVLPTLPEILKQHLGGTYTACLVRRGRNKMHAQPCIQVESPHIPGPAALKILTHSIDQICQKVNHQPIPIHFAQGTVRKLDGSEEADDDGAGESAASQRLRFNFIRPFPRPGMGASLGLLCSKRVSATLGGYVIIDGEKYMLTSDHFVSTAQEPANSDGDSFNSEELTSPSRQDLMKMEQCLKQSKRDLDIQINTEAQQDGDDEDIPEQNLSDHDVLGPELREKHMRMKDIDNLLDQVTKPPNDYAVGSIFRRSVEPRRAPIPRSLAEVIQQDPNTLNYQMDWSLCKLGDQAGENRHKYRSNQDALADEYVDISDHANQPGQICHETCEVESGFVVFYVGQGSQHRSGIVNIPMLISKDSSETYAWAIMSEEGDNIQYSHVAGDSGAWIIRQNCNKLIGQVHGYSNGKVLFTPIDVIFDDLYHFCGYYPSLSPRSSDPTQPREAVEVRPLCNVSDSSCGEPYKWLIKFSPSSDDSAKKSTMPRLAKIGPGRSSSKLTNFNDDISTDDEMFCSESCDSPSSLPSLTDSLRSPEAEPESPQSIQSLDSANGSHELLDGEIDPFVALRNTGKQTKDRKIPNLVLNEHDKRAKVTQSQYGFLIHMVSIIKRSTWPIDGKRNSTSRRGKVRVSRHGAIDISASARSLLDGLLRYDRRIKSTGAVTSHIGAPHDQTRIHELLENSSDMDRFPHSLEQCNVVA